MLCPLNVNHFFLYTTSSSRPLHHLFLTCLLGPTFPLPISHLSSTYLSICSFCILRIRERTPKIYFHDLLWESSLPLRPRSTTPTLCAYNIITCIAGFENYDQMGSHIGVSELSLKLSKVNRLHSMQTVAQCAFVAVHKILTIEKMGSTEATVWDANATSIGKPPLIGCIRCIRAT